MTHQPHDSYLVNWFIKELFDNELIVSEFTLECNPLFIRSCIWGIALVTGHQGGGVLETVFSMLSTSSKKIGSEKARPTLKDCFLHLAKR